MWTVFEWIPRTLIGFLAPVGGAHGVDLAGFALGQVKVLSRKVHCMSLSSIHILYNHTPTALLKPYTEPWCGLLIFHWTEVVLQYSSVVVYAVNSTMRSVLQYRRAQSKLGQLLQRRGMLVAPCLRRLGQRRQTPLAYRLRLG